MFNVKLLDKLQRYDYFWDGIDTDVVGDYVKFEDVRALIEKDNAIPVVDLNEIMVKQIHDAYLKRFGPLPEEMYMNDILWHVLEMIKEYKDESSTN